MTIHRRLSWETIALHLRVPFQLSYGVSLSREANVLQLEGDSGWGEGTVPPYYGIDQADILALWEATAQRTDPFPDDPAEIAKWIGTEGPAPARCGLDLALHDRIARRRGCPLNRLLGLPKPLVRPTAFTIPIAAPEEMARMASEVPQFSVLKLKLGSEDDEVRLAAVRSARPDVRIYVDANAAWSPEEAVRRVEVLARYDLALVEQPVPKDELEGMGYVQAHTEIPIVADESVRTMDDVERLAAAGVRGINLKLMKVGGLSACLRMLQRARELGMRVMLGCMVETSIGVTAMAHLAGLADWLDLDAPLLVTNDPFEGVRYEGAQLYLPDRPGIGVVRVAEPPRG